MAADGQEGDVVVGAAADDAAAGPPEAGEVAIEQVLPAFEDRASSALLHGGTSIQVTVTAGHHG
ncbi:hypothetical protein JD79_03602 [Geodermatophilus normandii]|uniref:Uncharacterized protein n=1 Tax=Geodermatophilus normandii TaxID=1137989 RepID=A0A317QNA3_9ACTN|nr:hypothetical protein [Geodermatophilus normandii]PWW24423.1 hypothetical protein JD79_03602 [Geodermatophilus normandii]